MIQIGLFKAAKKPTQEQRLLSYLKDRQRAYIWEIVRDLHIYQYNARIHDLRYRGYEIRHGKDSSGDYYEYGGLAREAADVA